MRRSTRWLLAAAVAAIPLVLTNSILAQARIGDDGHALDANTRIGSYGYNSSPSTFLPSFGNTGQVQTQVGNSLGNQLITGNVTGGKEFRGGVPYTDPREFRGSMGSSGFDRFISGSAGTPAANQGISIPGEVTSFYGSKLATAPPKGFMEHGFTGTYTPASTPTPSRPVGMEIRVGGEVFNAQMLNSTELSVPGPIDPQTRMPTLLTASPLLGIRSLNGFEARNSLLNGGSRFAGQDSMFSRLLSEPGAGGQSRQDLSQPKAGVENLIDKSDNLMSGKPLNQGGNLARPMVTPFDAPQSTSMGGKALSADLTAKALDNTVRADQSMGSRLSNPVNQPNTQYSELQKRLDRYYIGRLQTDEDRNRDLVKQLRDKAATDKTSPFLKEPPKDNAPDANQGMPQPGRTGANQQSSPFGPSAAGPDYARIRKEIAKKPDKSTGFNPSAATPPGMGTGNLSPLLVIPEPLKIKSLAEGVQSPTLAIQLVRAEEMMRQGKFLAAVRQYDLAEKEAPNQLMIRLGRANAELGAGAYKQGEAHLRQALEVDPVLTMAQFDIKALFGSQRLETLVKDLKQIASRQADDPGPAFLLAYLAYNTDNPQQAREYLDLADNRSGGKDDFYRMLKTHWKLAASVTTQPAPNSK